MKTKAPCLLGWGVWEQGRIELTSGGVAGWQPGVEDQQVGCTPHRGQKAAVAGHDWIDYCVGCHQHCHLHCHNDAPQNPHAGFHDLAASAVSPDWTDCRVGCLQHCHLHCHNCAPQNPHAGFHHLAASAGDEWSDSHDANPHHCHHHQNQVMHQSHPAKETPVNLKTSA